MRATGTGEAREAGWLGRMRGDHLLRGAGEHGAVLPGGQKDVCGRALGDNAGPGDAPGTAVVV